VRLEPQAFQRQPAHVGFCSFGDAGSGFLPSTDQQSGGAFEPST
jgi:hypothetical protein